MRYELVDGCLVLMVRGERRCTIPADGALGFLFDSDGRRDGAMACLLCHGPHEDVLQVYRRHWATMQRAEPKGIEGKAIMAQLGAQLGCLGDTRSAKQVLRKMAEDLEFISIPVGDVTPEVLEEINACLAITGRVGKLQERLARLKAGEAGAPADTMIAAARMSP